MTILFHFFLFQVRHGFCNESYGDGESIRMQTSPRTRETSQAATANQNQTPALALPAQEPTAYFTGKGSILSGLYKIESAVCQFNTLTWPKGARCIADMLEMSRRDKVHLSFSLIFFFIFCARPDRGGPCSIPNPGSYFSCSLSSLIVVFLLWVSARCSSFVPPK